MTDTLFAPPDTHWQRLSPNYLRMKLTLIPLVWTVLFAAPAVVAFLVGPPWSGWAVVAAWAAMLTWRLLRAPPRLPTVGLRRA